MNTVQRGKPQCMWCGKEFKNDYELNRHLACHNSKSRFCTLCNLQVIGFEKHVFEVHKITVEWEKKTFTDFSAFNEWKLKIELETRSKYVKHTASYSSVKEKSITTFHCHRDGSFLTRGDNKRHLKRLGTNKINGNCPSIMKAEVKADCVLVTFIKTHVGHECDLGRTGLNKADKDAIAAKIASKIPLQDILDGIRGSLTEDGLQPIHLANKQDLRNITTQYKLDVEQHDSNDAVAVDIWVQQMKLQSDLVRFYKPQGIIIPRYPQLKADDFCLILANNVQIDMLENFGNDVISIDGTHGLNGYDFQLYTILVVDEMRSGFPCAFMFSNRGDTLMIEIFFKTIISYLQNEICPNYFMSDMDETFFNAWISVNSDCNTQQLYCVWHVDRAWQQNLTKIKDIEKKAQVYKQIKVLMIEKDLNAFNGMKESLLHELFMNEQTKEFAKYFERFAHEPTKWAYCYRLNAGINTNMAIEVFHRNLKHIYLSGKKVKKLIKSIYALQKFIRDRTFSRLINLHKGNINHKLSTIRKRHTTSKSLHLDMVAKVSEEEWNVFSETEVYTINLMNRNCNCKLRCEECATCLHTFSCTCTDAAILWNMCKHIHLVGQYNAKNLFDDEENALKTVIDSTSNITKASEFLVAELAVQKPVSNLELEKEAAAHKVLNILENVKSSAGLQAFLKCVAPMEAMINAAEDNSVIPPLNLNEDIFNEPPNKKICSQRAVMLHSTKKSVKCNQDFKNPAEKRQIR